MDVIDTESLITALQHCRSVEKALTTALKCSGHVQASGSEIGKVVPGDLPLKDSPKRLENPDQQHCVFCNNPFHDILNCRKMKFYRSQMRKNERNKIQKQ